MEWLSWEIAAYLSGPLIVYVAWIRHRAARHRRANEARERHLDRLRNLN
ncbi:MAG: hypothetical protein KJ622_13005 [Alphaproteobacteria bacterium]|nr:hypothetical protein [Alphaproteobacteria bacterium]